MRKAYMKSRFFKGPFICPECGSTQLGPVDLAELEDGQRRVYTCATCNFEIPIFLAERWGGISVDDAMREWRQLYRADASKSKGVKA